jgi:hypothetical protein
MFLSESIPRKGKESLKRHPALLPREEQIL